MNPQPVVLSAPIYSDPQKRIYLWADEEISCVYSRKLFIVYALRRSWEKKVYLSKKIIPQLVNVSSCVF